MADFVGVWSLGQHRYEDERIGVRAFCSSELLDFDLPKFALTKPQKLAYKSSARLFKISPDPSPNPSEI